MPKVQVSYIVDDVAAAIAFYTEHLGFKLNMHPAPPFAAPPPPRPGGWNCFAIEVSDIQSVVDRLRQAGAHFRNDVVTGVGGKQIILEDPSGNPIELFEPLRQEARLAT